MKIPLVTTSSRVSCADVEIGVMNHVHDNIPLLLPSRISSDCPIFMKEKTKNLHDQFHLERSCYFWPDCLSSEIIQWDSIFSNFSHTHKHKSKHVTKVSHDFMFIYCLNTEVVAAFLFMMTKFKFIFVYLNYAAAAAVFEGMMLMIVKMTVEKTPNMVRDQ